MNQIGSFYEEYRIPQTFLQAWKSDFTQLITKIQSFETTLWEGKLKLDVIDSSVVHQNLDSKESGHTRHKVSQTLIWFASFG
jgi:hypothetical protein